MTQPQLIHTIAPLLDHYDGFLLDLWGVLHNGKHTYPGALEALELLREKGKKVVLLSNAPRRAEITTKGLSKFKINPDLFDAILTSGQVTYEALQARSDNWLKNLGNRCYFLGSYTYHLGSYQDGLDLTFVDDVSNASFVLGAGVYEDDDRFDKYQPLLDDALHHSLPMLCANPDLRVWHDGKTVICPGTFANYYEERGGSVRRYGKPDSTIFERALKLLGTTKDKTIMVGDSLATDIKGANDFGIASLWVLGGIHLGELKLAWGEAPDDATSVLNFSKSEPPRYIAPAFRTA